MKKLIGLHLNEATITALKIAAIEEKTTASEIAEQAINALLKKRGKEA